MLKTEQIKISLSEYQLQLLILAIDMANIPCSLQYDYNALRTLLCCSRKDRKHDNKVY